MSVDRVTEKEHSLAREDFQNSEKKSAKLCPLLFSHIYQLWSYLFFIGLLLLLLRQNYADRIIRLMYIFPPPDFIPNSLKKKCGPSFLHLVWSFSWSTPLNNAFGSLNQYLNWLESTWLLSRFYCTKWVNWGKLPTADIILTHCSTACILMLHSSQWQEDLSYILRSRLGHIWGHCAASSEARKSHSEQVITSPLSC